MTMLSNKRILLIISGGIAAYKSLELIRLLKKDGASVRCILTNGGAQFVTPLSVASLSGEQVYTDLWSLKDETEMGHIRLSREADLVVVAPASADIMAKMAHGMANDLATTTLLATDKPVMVCPAMNQMMWAHAATQANAETLKGRGITFVGPASGDMACGETGEGRLIEPDQILAAIQDFFLSGKPLAGLTALVTAGPTYEAIDPVRFIGNRSSGKQGYAIAESLRDLGASVTLVSGPTALSDPQGIKTIRTENASDMLEICQNQLPCDIAVCAAAVADWTAATPSKTKMKKGEADTSTLALTKTQDILATLSAPSPKRPNLVIGFAAETDNVADYARAKLAKKGCDWIIANPVDDGNPVFGSDLNQVYFITSTATEEWPKASKQDVARKLGERIASFFAENDLRDAAE